MEAPAELVPGQGGGRLHRKKGAIIQAYKLLQLGIVINPSNVRSEGLPPAPEDQMAIVDAIHNRWWFDATLKGEYPSDLMAAYGELADITPLVTPHALGLRRVAAAAAREVDSSVEVGGAGDLQRECHVRQTPCGHPQQQIEHWRRVALNSYRPDRYSATLERAACAWVAGRRLSRCSTYTERSGSSGMAR